MGQYRPEIDGLRALAVILVLLFHAKVPGFDAGLLGVDLFFVISGFLITGLIWKDATGPDGNRFSILEFYERRARRLLPALFVMMAVCVPFAWVWMLPLELVSFSRSLVAATLFVGNINFWRVGDYFAWAADYMPLMHTWTLAVEEQFYLVFPLFLMALLWFGKRAAVIGITLAALVSFGISEWGWRNQPMLNYFLLPSRGYELAMGALLAIAVAERQSAKVPGFAIDSVRTGNLLSLAGLSMILFAIIWMDSGSVYSMNYPLLPCVGMVAILAGAVPGTFVYRLFTLKVLRGIGLISYSTYLWHYPLFSFAAIRMMGDPSPSVKAGLIAASFLLGAISWRLIEQPFRNRSFLTRNQIFALSGGAASILVALGLTGYFFGGGDDRLSDDAIAVLETAKEVKIDERRCVSRDGYLKSPEEACVYGDPSNPVTAVIWGDSHANALAPSIGDAIGGMGLTTAEFSFPACFPIPGINYNGRVKRCDEFNQMVWRHVLSNDGIRLVILSARWDTHVENRGFDNGRGGAERHIRLQLLPAGQDGPVPKRYDLLQSRLNSLTDDLLAAGKTVVLVYPVPPMGWNVPMRLLRQDFLNSQRNTDLSIPLADVQAYAAGAVRMLDNLGQHERLIRVNPQDALCDRESSGRCEAVIDGRPLYFDDDHLSRLGADLVARQLTAVLSAGVNPTLP